MRKMSRKQDTQSKPVDPNIQRRPHVSAGATRALAAHIANAMKHSWKEEKIKKKKMPNGNIPRRIIYRQILSQRPLRELPKGKPEEEQPGV
jgi:hypothetical protein